MRRLIFNRYIVWMWLIFVSHAWFVGQNDATKGGLVVALLFWLIAGCPRLLWWPNRNPNERLVRNAVRSPRGKTETDLSGCYTRLDPALRGWLRDDTNARSEGNRHVQ